MANGAQKRGAVLYALVAAAGSSPTNSCHLNLVPARKPLVAIVGGLIEEELAASIGGSQPIAIQRQRLATSLLAWK